MASSFRIKLKLSGNNNNKSSDTKEHQPQQQRSSPNSTLNNSPTRSTFERGSSVVDDASLISEEAIEEEEEEEIDELEDSPPPADEEQRTSRSKSGKVRKLSGAAAMKAAKSLKRAKVASATPISDGEASSRSRMGSQEGSPTPSAASGSSRKRSTIVGENGKTIDEMSMAEIEALPAAKRRKGMKLRGAAGPGRGWRKGLKMDMKPIYRPLTDSPPSTVAPGTPPTFSQQRPKSALGRDALSKANTPMRSESPFDETSSIGEGSRTMEDISGNLSTTSNVKSSRAFPASHAAVAARKARAAAGANAATASNSNDRIREGSHINTVQATSTSNSGSGGGGQTKQSIPTLQEEGRAIKAIIRGGPTVLPPPKIPIGFVAPAPLDTKNNATILVRKWQRKGREILSLGGRAWSAMSWLSEETNKFPTSAEMKASATNEKSLTNNNNTSTPVGGGGGIGVKSANMTGNATPNIISRAASPLPSSSNDVGIAGDATNGGQTSPSNVKKSVAPSPNHSQKVPSSTPNSPTAAKVSSPLPSSSTSKSSGLLSTADWKGSSAAFTAANRSRM